MFSTTNANRVFGAAAALDLMKRAKPEPMPVNPELRLCCRGIKICPDSGKEMDSPGFHVRADSVLWWKDRLMSAWNRGMQEPSSHLCHLLWWLVADGGRCVTSAPPSAGDKCVS